MKLKGDWSSEASYDVDDVVRWENGEIHHLQSACPVGTVPIDTMYWGKILGPISQVISMMIDLMNSTNTAVAALAETVPTNINDESIVLKSGDNEYLISVDATGDTPEVIAELIEPEEAAEGGET